jgi:hypothetical protein
MRSHHRLKIGRAHAAVVQHKSNGERLALVVVRTGSEVGIEEGGCSPRELEQVRLQVVADQAGSKHIGDFRNRGKGSRRGRSQRRTVQGLQMGTFGDKRDCFRSGVDTCLCSRAGLKGRDGCVAAFVPIRVVLGWAVESQGVASWVSGQERGWRLPGCGRSNRALSEREFQVR